MLRKSLLFLVPALIGVISMSAKSADTTAPIEPEPAGTVVNETAPAGKTRFWVFRTADDAVAINVVKIGIPKKLKATLLQYKPGIDGYELQKITIAGVTNPLDSVEVELVEKTNTISKSTYFDLQYTPPGALPISLGTMKYVEGKDGRSSSDVVVRFNSTTMTSVRRPDPCAEPLTDDMGEEEELDESGATLPSTQIME